MPKDAKNCEKLLKVAKSRQRWQKLPKDGRNCHKLPEDGKSCQKMPKVVKSFEDPSITNYYDMCSVSGVWPGHHCELSDRGAIFAQCDANPWLGSEDLWTLES